MDDGGRTLSTAVPRKLSAVKPVQGNFLPIWVWWVNELPRRKWTDRALASEKGCILRQAVEN